MSTTELNENTKQCWRGLSLPIITTVPLTSLTTSSTVFTLIVTVHVLDKVKLRPIKCQWYNKGTHTLY